MVTFHEDGKDYSEVPTWRLVLGIGVVVAVIVAAVVVALWS